MTQVLDVGWHRRGWVGVALGATVRVPVDPDLGALMAGVAGEARSFPPDAPLGARGIIWC